MTVSIGTIAQQALRRLGVRVVPLDDSPTLNEFVSFADIANAAATELGVLNSDARLVPPGSVPQSEIATKSLVELGVLNSDETLATPSVVLAADIVTTALIELGVLNSTDAFTPQPTIPVDDIAGAALIELGVIAADEIPSTSDLLLATEKVVVVHDGLHARGIAKWESGAIPASVAEEYIKLTAAMVAGSFGKAVDPAVVALLEGRIRQGATVMTMVPVMMGHLIGAHESLVARGIALWNINAIPAAVAEEYHKLLVALASVSFGRPETDPAIVQEFEGRIRAAAMVLNNNQAFMMEQVSFVHGSLEAQGLASWNIDQIPRAFAEDYIKLTSAYSAASFGKPIDPALIALIEDHIRKGAMVLNADAAFMQTKVAWVHAALDAQGVVWWPSGWVPQAFAEEYTKLTVAYAAADFGKQVDPATVQLLEARVRKGAMVLSSDDNAQQAVQAVHSDLVARGCARWTVFDIPDHVGDHYVTLAADRLAPMFGVQVDANDARAAMISIYRFIALPTSGETVATAYF